MLSSGQSCSMAITSILGKYAHSTPRVCGNVEMLKSLMGVTSILGKPFQRSVATAPTSTAGHAAAFSRTRQIHSAGQGKFNCFTKIASIQKIASPRPLSSSTLARAKDMTGLHMDASRNARDQVLPDTSAPQPLPTRRHYVKPTFSRATPCATGILSSYAVPQTVSNPLRQALNLKLQRMCRKSVGTRIESGLNDTELAKARRVWTVCVRVEVGVVCKSC